ncbi:serine/threonine-protein phosphatase 6 regulatory ankyrin repeat subunit B-like isoform X2 [Octopus sinensis]|uniref:Serine/threonine-protein phosphatase 6 regulatory ankyrin repeat subunit B-like isoform X2 n=1 Tax=Octopus sinensis TaxID=2607531 RepID=A0A6P7TJU1_9MOLL|nr:serine/threonine-protein phosphatase 6 regulatory ankyrin repeat subunit B-like isoform X2 [Octopus sinensis]
MDSIFTKIITNDVKGLKTLIEEKPGQINKRDECGVTPLIEASYYGKARIIEMLIDAGADVGARDHVGCTALHWAVDGDRLQAVEILLSRGSDVNAQSNDGQTPLHWACFWGHLHTVELLLGHNGIDANAVDNDGDTPIYVAVRGRRYDVVSVMLNQRSVQLDIQNKKKRTPLLEAISQGHLGMTHKLIAIGANINAVDGDGNSCLHLAVKTEVFNSEDAPMDLLNECCTALTLKNEEMLSGIVVARYLASQGADFHHKNNKNNTPLDLIKDPNLREKLETFLPPQCLWCRNKAATTKVHPCGHLVICKGCSNVPLQQCLKCLKPVISRGRVEAPKFEDRCVQTEATCQELGAASQAIEAPTRGKSEPTSSTSQPVESPVLDEKFLQDVAQNFGGKWQQVGRELGIKSVQLEFIRYDYPYNTVEQSFQMLRRWFTTCDPETRTHRTLRKALDKFECFDALKCLPQTM